MKIHGLNSDPLNCRTITNAIVDFRLSFHAFECARFDVVWCGGLHIQTSGTRCHWLPRESSPAHCMWGNMMGQAEAPDDARRP